MRWLGQYVPIVVWLPAYSRTWLRGATIAGGTLVALA